MESKLTTWSGGCPRYVSGFVWISHSSLTALLGQLIEKQSTSSAQSLTELQTELKSLKSLLIARRPTPASPSSSSTLTTPNAPAPGNNVLPPPAASSSYSPASPSSSAATTDRASSPGLGIRKPGIPSWQMRSSTTGAGLASSASPLPGSSYQTSTATVTPSAEENKVEAQEDTSASGVLVQKEDATAAPSVSEGGKKVTIEDGKEGSA